MAGNWRIMSASFPGTECEQSSLPFTMASLAAQPDPLPDLTVPQTPNLTPLVLLGVDYFHRVTADGGDLYLTRFGLPFLEPLDPANWFAPDWFAGHRQRLPGTSAVFRTPTRPVRDTSLDLVVRFSRVGEPVPADTLTMWKHIHADFNSPFEEFAAVLQLRASRAGASHSRLLTKKPLAIYVPAERLHLWQTGRSESKIEAKRARHPDIPLDIHRQYILLYGWIDGQNAAQTADALALRDDARRAFLADAMHRAIVELAQHGFRMLDIKPEHIVLRFGADGSLLRRHDGYPAYALVDYELLERFHPPDGALSPLSLQAL